MRTIECIHFRSCQPIGQRLAKQLVEHFGESARSRGLVMSVWLDTELPGDLYIHLEREDEFASTQKCSIIGFSIERMLDSRGLVSRRILQACPELKGSESCER